MHVRRAVSEDAERLSALALTAKAHWGYAEAQLEEWRPNLEISAESVLARPTFVGELSGKIVGFYSLVPSTSAWELDNLWVAPQHMRCGLGRELISHAMQTAAAAGATSMIVDADPNAESFYIACGAKRIGEVAAPIAGQPARVRPQLMFAITRSNISLESRRSVSAAQLRRYASSKRRGA